MKKLVLALTVVAVAGSNIQSAHAGDKEWATAGKVLTGLFAGAVIADIAQNHHHRRPVYTHTRTTTYVSPAYSAPAVVEYRAPIVVQRPPVVVHQAPVVVQRAPVVVRRAPVVVTPAPVVVRPAPVVCPAPVVVRQPVYVPAPRVVIHKSYGHGHKRHYGHGSRHHGHGRGQGRR